MNLQNSGVKRPKLSLHFGGRPAAKPAVTKPDPAILADHELRRLVAAMID